MTDDIHRCKTCGANLQSTGHDYCNQACYMTRGNQALANKAQRMQEALKGALDIAQQNEEDLDTVLIEYLKNALKDKE